MRTSALLERLVVALLAVSAAATNDESSADLVSRALRMHAQSTVLPTHLLEDPTLFHGRHLMSNARRLQAVESGGRYVQIKNPAMRGGCVVVL